LLHVGNSLGTGYGAVNEQAVQTPEQNIQDYINQNGPIDFVKPVVAITSPAANAQISTGSPMTVTIQATDNTSIAKVRASFDANGDAVVGPTEIVTAVPAGGNLYTATFSTISGSLTPRTLTAIAIDASGNTAKTSISLNVGTVSQFALTVTETGTGTGTVSSSPAGISCPSTCSANYTSPTVVTLTATAGTGATFAGWSGACTGTGTCAVTMSQARAVTATFNQTVVQFALAVTEAGTGTGTVSSSPAGISCPSTCSANFNSGTAVTLTATAGTGATFAGWTGACTGTGTCAVTMSQARAVTATFNQTVAGSFTLTAAPATKTIGQGDFAPFLITETATGGFSGPITLSVTGMPAGATSGFTVNPFTSGSSAMYIVTRPTTTIGSYPLTITGTSGAITRTLSVTMVVTAHGPVDFSFSVAPTTRTVTRGNSATYTLTETPAGGFTGAVTPLGVNVPAGATLTFAPSPFTGSTTATIATTASTPVGTYQIILAGYSGSLLHTIPVTLIVQ